jgi:mediator of RNA polymerase II transcription subunit 14
MSLYILLEVIIDNYNIYIIMGYYVDIIKNKVIEILYREVSYLIICILNFRELTSKDPRSELGYKLTVQVDQHDPARPLAVVHIPSLGNKVKITNNSK